MKYIILVNEGSYWDLLYDEKGDIAFYNTEEMKEKYTQLRTHYSDKRIMVFTENNNANLSKISVNKCPKKIMLHRSLIKDFEVLKVYHIKHPQHTGYMKVTDIESDQVELTECDEKGNI